MDTMSYIIGRNSAGGGTSSTPSWSDITNKPFNTIGSGLEVDNGALAFDERELSGYVKTNQLATVATSGDYDDLSNKPTIPQPTSVTVTQTLQTGTAIADIDVDGVTTTLYAPAGGGSVDWTDITNKPSIKAGNGFSSVVEGNSALNTGSYAHAEGNSCQAEGPYSHAEGDTSKTKSWAYSSHAEGNNTIASDSNQHTQGKYNIENPWNATNIHFADIIGNGTSNSARSNAEATDWSGNKYLAGDIYVKVTDWTDPQNNSVKLANIPAPPTTAGTYTLQVVVDSDGIPTYSWI